MTAKQFIRCRACRIRQVEVFGWKCVQCDRRQEEKRHRKRRRERVPTWQPRRSRISWCPDPATCAAFGKCGTVGAQAAFGGGGVISAKEQANG